MNAPTPARLLDLWELIPTLEPQAWALAALVVAGVEEDERSAGAQSVGSRDQALLAWRRSLFGDALLLTEPCPYCEELLELEMDAGMLASPLPGPREDEFFLSVDGIDLRFRLPDGDDMVAAARCPGVQEARALIATRCVLDATGPGGRPVDALSALAIDQMSERLSLLDEPADIRLHVACASCTRSSDLVFDIAPILAQELDLWAARCLSEVHALASMYGWTEHEILALSPARRSRYLALAGA